MYTFVSGDIWAEHEEWGGWIVGGYNNSITGRTPKEVEMRLKDRFNRLRQLDYNSPNYDDLRYAHGFHLSIMAIRNDNGKAVIDDIKIDL